MFWLYSLWHFPYVCACIAQHSLSSGEKSSSVCTTIWAWKPAVELENRKLCICPHFHNHSIVSHPNLRVVNGKKPQQLVHLISITTSQLQPLMNGDNGNWITKAKNKEDISCVPVQGLHPLEDPIYAKAKSEWEWVWLYGFPPCVTSCAHSYDCIIKYHFCHLATSTCNFRVVPF